MKLLNRQGKTTAFQWVPSHAEYTKMKQLTDLFKKNGTTPQNKQKLLNFKRIKMLIKQKTQEKFSQEATCLIQQDTVAKHQIHMRKQLRNKPRKQAPANFRLNTSIASESSTITTAQYAN